MQAPHRSIEPRDGRERFLVELLDGLWERYRARVEPVRRYEALVERSGGVFRNDHVAFRTLAWQRPTEGIASIARLFEALGYRAAGCYAFPDKKLSSLHFEHPNARLPKLFVSQLECWKLSPAARAVIARVLETRRAPLPDDALAELASGTPGPELLALCKAFLAERPWRAPAREDVLALDEESQFGAWVLVHGYEVNHFTAAVHSHACAALADIDRTVAALRADGVAMKDEIEGAPGSPLRQSSTQAAVIPVEVAGGTMDWTYAYFELAERRAGFEGFLGPQAANLFDVTAYKPPTSK